MGGSKTKNKSPSSSSDGPPIKVTRSNKGDRKAGPFSEKTRMKYNTGKRSFSLVLSQEGLVGRVFVVGIKIKEKVKGKSSAKLCVQAMPDQANGATSAVCTDFNGTVKVEKGKLTSPPLPDTEFVTYDFTDAKSSSSSFIVEKKSNAGFIEKITAIHCFPISEDAVYRLAIKIVTNKKGEGLCVEVEGPVKHSKDFVDKQIKKCFGKLENKIEQQVLNALFGGSSDKDMKLLQSMGSYVNAGKQNQNGLVNTSGSMMGFGNGSIFSGCRISRRNK